MRGSSVNGDLRCDIVGDCQRVEDSKVMKKPANLLTPYINILPRCLLQALMSEDLLKDDELDFAARCYRSNFTMVRFTVTVAFYSMASDFARRELRELLEFVGYNVDSLQGGQSAENAP